MVTTVEPQVLGYANLMHEAAKRGAQRLVENDRAAVVLPSLDLSGQPRRIVMVKVTDGSVLVDATADPYATSGPEAYSVVLDTLDAAVRELGAFETVQTKPFAKRTETSLVCWDPMPSRANPVARLVIRHGWRFLPRHARRYPWLTARWNFAGMTYAMWYGEPSPWRPRGRLVGDFVMSALRLGRRVSSSPGKPGAGGRRSHPRSSCIHGQRAPHGKGVRRQLLRCARLLMAERVQNVEVELNRAG